MTLRGLILLWNPAACTGKAAWICRQESAIGLPNEVEYPRSRRFVQSSWTWRRSLKRCGQGRSPSGSSSFVAAPSLRDPAVPARPLVRTVRVADRPRISWVVHRRFADEFSCFRQISVGWSSVPCAGLHCDGLPWLISLAAGWARLSVNIAPMQGIHHHVSPSCGAKTLICFPKLSRNRVSARIRFDPRRKNKK